MSSATPLHLALGCLAACCLAGGCRPGDAVQSTPAPGGRTACIRLPVEIRPIQANDGYRLSESDEVHSGSISAGPSTARGDRAADYGDICGKSADGRGAYPRAGPPEVTEPPLTPPMRSEFVPIAMPEPAAPPRTAALPELAPSRLSIAQILLHRQILRP